MKKLFVAGSFFVALGFFFVTASAQNSTTSSSSGIQVNSTQSTSYNLPWKPIKVTTQITKSGKVFEFHQLDPAEYQRYVGRLPQMYVSDLDDCRRQAGDCMETVVIRPMD